LPRLVFKQALGGAKEAPSICAEETTRHTTPIVTQGRWERHSPGGWDSTNGKEPKGLVRYGVQKAPGERRRLPPTCENNGYKKRSGGGRREKVRTPLKLSEAYLEYPESSLTTSSKED